MNLNRKKINGVNLYEIHIELYDKYYYIIFGEKDYDILIKDDDEIEKHDWNDFEALFRRGETNEKMLVFKSPDNKFLKNGVVAHEILHLMYYILEENGLKFDFNNQEPTTYLLEYIIKQTGLVFEAERLRIKRLGKKRKNETK